MIIELTIRANIDIDQCEYPDITPETVLDGVTVYESDVLDGFEITTDISGLDNTQNFFLKDAVLVDKHFVDMQELGDTPTMNMGGI